MIIYTKAFYVFLDAYDIFGSPDIEVLLLAFNTGEWGALWNVWMVFRRRWNLLVPEASIDMLGYTWEPQLAVPISSALVLYPISAGFTFFTMITLLPVLFARSTRSDKIFAISAWISFALSFLAFLFMIGIWGVAKSRFEKRGFDASYGNLPWMSLAASLLLLIVALSPYFLGPIRKGTPHPTHARHRYQTDLEARRSTRPKHRSPTEKNET